MEGGWWNEAFRSAYLEVYQHRSDAQAAEEVAGLLPRLRAAPGPVVDAGCGAGRHLAALRAAGLPAIGFDLSGDLLAVARSRPTCAGRLVRSDLRAPPVASGCGAVLCLFTAFGYFDDAANRDCLAALAALIAPGGWVVLDLPEPEQLRKGLQASTQRISANGWRIVEHRRLTATRVEKDVEAVPPSGSAVCWQESVRLYDRTELSDLAASVGLVGESFWPGLGGPEDHSGRQVAWLHQPGPSDYSSR